MKILFVCTGNICRSPSAEGVMRYMIADAGLLDTIQIDSAGTHNYHAGEAPDKRSVATAKARGYDLSELKARNVEVDDFHAFTHILALDNSHIDALEALAPKDHAAKLALFLDYSGVSHGAEVPDPYYGGQAGFEHVLDLVEEGCEKLLMKLTQR